MRKLPAPLFVTPLCLTSMASFAAPAQAAPRVAVFAQPGFPYYNASPLVTPKQIAADLAAAGVRADLLDARALADPARFSARTYDAVVLPYGNAYPQAAFANLKAFHQAGGCLVLSGIPFTHAVEQRGRRLLEGPRARRAPRRCSGRTASASAGLPAAGRGRATVAPGDPLGLRALGRDWSHGSAVQTLDVASLPAQDQVIPILTRGRVSPPPR